MVFHDLPDRTLRPFYSRNQENQENQENPEKNQEYRCRKSRIAVLGERAGGPEASRNQENQEKR